MQRSTLITFASRASVIVALFLTSIKLYAFYKTQSLSVLSSLLDSGVDMIASIAGLISITFALKPADSKFRFGYGKLEAVAALIQGVIIIVSLLFLIAEVVERLVTQDTTIHEVTLGFWVMITSIVITIGLVIFQNYVIKKTDSIAIKADALHYKSDLALNFGVIVSLYASQYYAMLDSVFCLLVVVYVIWSMRTIIAESLEVLLDKEINTPIRDHIIEIIKNHPQINGFHNFRTRTSGNRIFIEAHIEMNPNLTLVEAHNIAHDLKDKIQETYKNTDIILHQDPEGHDTPNEKLF